MTSRPIRFAAALALVMLGACGGGGDAGGAAGAGGAKAGAGGGSGGSGGAAGSSPSGVAGSGGASGGGGSGGAAGSAAGAGGAAGSASDAGLGSDAGADAHATGDAGAAPLTQFLRIIQVTTVQGGQTVSISIDGQKNHNGTIHAAQALTMRIHVRPDTGWVAHLTVAELHLVSPSMPSTDVTLSATRTITGASTAGNLDSTFNFDLTAAQVTKDLRFQVALRDPTGVPETPPPMVQRALYPRDGTLDTLDAQ